MPEDAPRPAQAAIRTELGSIFVSLELSRRTWLVTSLSPGGGEKMSKRSGQASDIAGLLRRSAQLKAKARARTGGTSLSSQFKRPAWTASGSIACCRAKGSKATWSTPRRSRPRAGVGGRRWPLASTADPENGPGLLSPTAGRGMLVQQHAATVCELDLVAHAIRSCKRAQTLDLNQPPENCP
jgi:hypothetical protein